MDQDQQIARDRHQEVITSIAALRGELTATRLEVKTDLNAYRIEAAEALDKHIEEDTKKFDAIGVSLDALRGWKTRTATLGGAGVFCFTTAAAFVSAAFASGRF